MPVLLLLTLALTADQKLKPPIRIALYQLELQDVPMPVGVVVDDSLLQEVRKLMGVNAIGMSEIRDMLSHEATMQLAGCSESGESCMAELAGALGVDELLTGKLAKVGDASVITLRRLDHKRGEVTKVFDQRLKLGSGQEYLAVVGPAVEQLYADFALRNGQTRGVSKEVGLRLDPPPIPRGVTIGIAAAGVAAAIAAGIVGVLMLTAQADYTTYAKTGETSPIQGPELQTKRNTLQGRADAANALWITTGGLGLVAGIMAFFTDWKDYRGQVAQLSVSAQ